MKNFTKLFFCAAALFVAFACSSPSSTPSGTTEAVYKAMQSGDYETFSKYVYAAEDLTPEKAAEFRTGVSSMLEEKATKMYEKKGGLESFEILSEEISEDGTKAKVAVKTIYGDGSDQESNVPLIKQGDKWYVEIGK